jgi:hypothetical protein
LSKLCPVTAVTQPLPASRTADIVCNDPVVRQTRFGLPLYDGGEPKHRIGDAFANIGQVAAEIAGRRFSSALE